MPCFSLGNGNPFLKDSEAHPESRPAIKLVIVDLALGWEGEHGIWISRTVVGDLENYDCAKRPPLNHLVL